MSKLLHAMTTGLRESEQLRVALLAAASFALGLAFLAQLAADEARAAF